VIIFGNYCTLEYLLTIKNLFSLFCKKNKIIINTLFFDFNDVKSLLKINEKTQINYIPKEIVKNNEEIIDEIYLKLEDEKEEEERYTLNSNEKNKDENNLENINKNNNNKKSYNKKEKEEILDLIDKFTISKLEK